jgi:phenylpropionate dioxygenase-like ring-hydroxylating dioxygenase large terminal subunit
VAPRPTLAPRDYVDPTVYEHEVRTVLGTSWLPVARVEQVPEPGDRIALDLLGRPLVVVRGADGEVRVLSNVCPHRGSVIVPEGAGHDATLVCPYHRWVFRLDGSFVGGPLTGDADLDDVCLTAARHTVWQGFVLVDPSGTAPAPDRMFPGLAAAVGPWRWGELEVVGSRRFTSRWNWKVMVENWIECYHHLGTHRESLEPLFPARTTAVADGGDGSWCAMTVDGIEGIGGDPDRWIPGLDPALAGSLSVWAAFPLLLAGAVADHGFWLQLVPIDTEHHEVVAHVLVHPDHPDRRSPERLEPLLDLFAAVHEEDMATCEAVQRGLRSGAIDRLRLVPLEESIAVFQRWVGARRGD